MCSTQSVPGANKLRHVPILLMLAMASVSVDAPTVMLLGALEGDMVQLSPPLLLPAMQAIIPLRAQHVGPLHGSDMQVCHVWLS